MSQKVLITGGSGFLGYHLIMAALEKKIEVYAAVRSKSNIEHLKGLPINFTSVNYDNTGAIEKELSEKKYDFIIHAAGITKSNSLKEFDYINGVYTSNLAQAAAQLNGQVKKLVLISSLAAAGPLKDRNILITEQTQPHPVTAYGRSKLKAEQALINVNIPSVILRPTAIYGPRDKDLFLISNYLQKGVDAYIGRVTQQLSFVHASDVATAAVQALLVNNAKGIYNITDGNNYSRYDFADIAIKILEKKPRRIHLPVQVVRSILFFVETVNKMGNKVPVVSREKLSELLAENWGCDISKAKNELGFSPVYNLQTGLEETINWYRRNKWL